MKYIKKLTGERLRWTQPNALIRYHELRADGALYATLRWKKMFGSLAVGECRKGRYTFKRAGFLRPYVTVRRDVYSQSDLATLRFTGGSIVANSVLGYNGILEFETGEKLAFNRLSLWRSKWAFTDKNGTPLVIFDRKTKAKPSADIIVNHNCWQSPIFDILLILGWYVIIMDYEEAEAAIGTGMVQTPGY